MKYFDKIAFVDDERKTIPYGIKVVGTCADLENIVCEYRNIIFAIGNPEVKFSLLQKIKDEIPFRIIALISPYVYVSPTAQIMLGSIIEPMAVIHTGSLISTGCIISVGMGCEPCEYVLRRCSC